MREAVPDTHPTLVVHALVAPPHQVIVVEDENGCIVRETMKDNDVLAQYKSMRETLVYLCHLDYDDTEHQMLDKLRTQVGAGGRLCVLAFRDWGLGHLCDTEQAGEGVGARGSAGARRRRDPGNYCDTIRHDCSAPCHFFAFLRILLTADRPGPAPQQQAGQRFAWQPLNTLCWAIGSIAGSMADDQVRKGQATSGRHSMHHISWTRWQSARFDCGVTR